MLGKSRNLFSSILHSLPLPPPWSFRLDVYQLFCLKGSAFRLACWHRAAIPALGNLRQENYEFQARQGYKTLPHEKTKQNKKLSL
jgi:hypothetical protein